MANELETSLTFPVDEGTLKKAIASLKEIDKEQKKVSQSTAKGEKTFEESSKAISKLEKQKGELLKTIRQLSPEFGKEAKGLKAITDEADTLDRRLEDLDERFSAISNQVGQAGDIESNIRSLGGTAGALGAGGAEKGVAVLAEGFAALEAAPKLSAAIRGLPDIVSKSSEALGLAGFAGKLQELIPGLGAGSASLLALGAAVLPIAAVIGAATFAFSQLKKISEEAAEAQRREIEARQLAIETQRELSDLTDVEAVQRRNQLFEQRAQLAQDIAREQDVLNGLRTNIGDDALGKVAGFFTGTNARISEQQKHLEELVNQASLVGVELQESELRIAAVGEVERQRAINAEQLAEIEKELIAAEGERTQLLAQQEAALARLTQFDTQREQERIAAAVRELQTQAKAGLEAEFAAQDQFAKEQEHRDTLSEIAAQGRDNLEKIEAEIASLPEERLEALSDIEAKAGAELAKIGNALNANLSDIAEQRNKDIAQLNQDFMKDQIKETKSFAKETAKIEDKNKTERLRLLQDITDSLNEAQRSNDVISFLKAQRDGQKELKRQSEDAKDAEKDRIDAFIAKQEDAQVAFLERQTDIEARAEEAKQKEIERANESSANVLAKIEEEKQKVNESFAERRTALLETVNAEKVAIQARLDAAIEAYDKQEAREAQQAERQRLRAQQVAIFEESNHQARLAQLNEQRNAIQSSITQIESQLEVTQARRDTLQGQAASLSGGISPFTAFAKGGVVTRPTLALIGDDGPETIIPGLPDSIGKNGRPVNVNSPVTIHLSVGDIATASQVTSAVEDAASKIMGTMGYIVERALSGGAA